MMIQENDHAITTESAKMESSLLLGHTAGWWDAVMLASLAIAAFVALLVAGATTGSVVANKREASAAKEELERYKLGVASQVAEAKTEGIKAGEKAGNALVRAADSEYEAAAARKETAKLEIKAAETNNKTEQLKAENLALQSDLIEVQELLIPRHIGGLPDNALNDFAKYAGTKVLIQFTPDDIEARNLAKEIKRLLEQFRWEPQFIDEKRSGVTYFDEGVEVYAPERSTPWTPNSAPEKSDSIHRAANVLAWYLSANSSLMLGVKGAGRDSITLSAKPLMKFPKDSNPAMLANFSPPLDGVYLVVGARPFNWTIENLARKRKAAQAKQQ